MVDDALRDERRCQGKQDEQDQEPEAHESQLVLLETKPEELPRASPRDGNARFDFYLKRPGDLGCNLTHVSPSLSLPPPQAGGQYPRRLDVEASANVRGGLSAAPGCLRCGCAF